MAIVANSYQSKIWTFESKTDTTPIIEDWGQHHGSWMGFRSEVTRVVLGLKCRIDAPIKDAKLHLQTQGGSETYGCYDTYIHVSTSELPVSTLLTLAYDVDSEIVKSQYKLLRLDPGWSADINLQISSTFADAELGGLPAGDIYVYLWSANTAKLYVDYPDYNLVTRIIEVTDLPYTKPSAPTSITAGATYTKQGGTITFKWSGASAGVSNPITKYKFVFSGAVSPSVTEYSDETSATSGSYTYSVPSSATQGGALKVAITTIGTVSGFIESSASSTVTITTINTPPTFTSVKLNKEKFKSDESTTTVTFSGANANNSGQTLTYWYTHDINNPSWEKISSSTVQLQTASPSERTIYFRIYDGLEYSSVQSKTYYRYPAPSVTISDSSLSNYAITASSTASGGNGTFTYKWTYNEHPLGTDASISAIDVKNCGINWGDPGTLKITVTSNGEEASASKSIIMHSAPSISTLYNQHGTSDITNGEGFFYENLRFIYTPDDAANEEATYSVAYRLRGTSSDIPVTASVINYEKGYVDFSVPTSLIHNSIYEFTLSISRGSLNTNVTISKIRAPRPEIDCFQDFIITYSQNNQTPTITIRDIFSSANAFNSLADTSIIFQMIKGTSKWEPLISSKTDQGAFIDLGITLTYPLDTNNLGLNLAGGQSSDIINRLILINVFGEPLSYDIGTTSFDWTADLVVGGFSVEYAGDAVSEGDNLKFYIDGLKHKYEETTFDGLKFDEKITYAIGMKLSESSNEITIWQQSSQDIPIEKAQEGTVEINAFYTMPEVTINSSKIYFIFHCFSLAWHEDFDIEKIVEYPLSQATTASGLVITKSTYEDKKLKVSSKWSSLNSNLGETGKAVIHLQYQDSDGNWIEIISQEINTSQINEKTISLEASAPDIWKNWSSNKLRVILITTSSENLNKTTYSSVVAVYNVSATVAYRHNSIGINTNSLQEEDTIIEIHPTNTQKKVIIYLAPDLNLDPIIIDTASGAVSGLTISGGSW